MIGATLSTRLAQHGTKSAVTAFALTFLAYNFKFLWAPIVDNVRLPLIGRFGQRRSWLWLVGVLVMAAVAFLGIADPQEALYGRDRGHPGRRGWCDLRHHHRCLPHRAARAATARRGLGHVAIRLAHRRGRRRRAGARPRSPAGWAAAYVACAAFALPAMLVGVVMGEPARHREPAGRTAPWGSARRVLQPARSSSGVRARSWCSSSCSSTRSATRSPTTLRLLFQDLGFTNDEVAFYDVGIGFAALLVGVFVGGILYARLGMKRSVLVSRS